ncbi:uncharacterized protein BX663DRAFT_499262, partial [Cokeromyces recurvatus]|uniref:uncharacterized protein n=1 Tax=Cokeromyces recurvatus TaxID=90255 RepID=UPI002220DA31
MTSEAPVNAGHRFANAAEEYEEQEEWEKAADSHSKAAEHFENAMNDTVDAEAIRTLLLLSSNHKRKSNELRRKAQRVLKSNNNQQINLTNETKDSLQPLQQKKSIVSRLAGDESHKISEIGESYALLSNEDQDDDPFNKFLEAVESLVQQLFNPAVAFTSAPLNENDNPIPTLQEDNTKTILNMADSYFIVPNPKELLTFKSDCSPERDPYELENEKLRIQVAQLRKKLRALELSAEENNMLKSSVLQFRNDVHKQAKRIMQSHHESSMRSSATTLLGVDTIHNSFRYHLPVLMNGGTDLSTYM